MMNWPPDYVAELQRRARLLNHIRSEPGADVAANAYYANHLHAFVNDWGTTVDPRNARSKTPVVMPFMTFKRQDEFLDFLLACLESEADGLVEKSRDMGATWLCVALSVWLWRYWKGAAVGWGSRKEQLVDKLGDPDSIFEKIRIYIKYLPRELLPRYFNPKDHLTYMKVINPENGSTITGESGDNIGRGGRKLIYFKDESAHYEHPESIEAALGDNTNVQIDISSVHGLGNVFHRRREQGTEWNPGQLALGDTVNVFIMDWRDHPAKTQAWHDQRKAKAKAAGLLHLFAQEVDRDYASSVEGVIIPSDWIQAAVDAHLKLDYLSGWDDGLWGAGLDVADGGIDKNALAVRKGPILHALDEWGDRDTGVTTRRAIDMIKGLTPIDLQYDCIGVGSGVKAEFNRLREDETINLPEDLNLVAWNAGAAVLHPFDLVIPKTDEDDGDNHGSPMNKDFYANLKAQGWWELRRRFEKTYRAVHEGEFYSVDELISLPSNLRFLKTAIKELAQPTAGPGARLKMTVNKMPEGAKSPNLGDAIMMAYWPIPSEVYGRASFSVYTLGAS